jgi:general L-amino acid transport system permease protein
MSDMQKAERLLVSPTRLIDGARFVVTSSGSWAKRNLFSSWSSTAITLLLGYLLCRAAISAVEWGIFRAVWTAPPRDSEACRIMQGSGACWALVNEKLRFILFGPYPFAQQWRPSAAVLLFLSLYFVSARRSFWRREIVLIWMAGLTAIAVLMRGGVFGLPAVPTDAWGGLPVTLILATFGITVAFPLAVFVALGRRSPLPVLRWLCISYVELIRGVPLISLLFVASVIFPLFVPEGMNFDKLVRAQVAIILFAGAYLAEVIRGGLQSLPKGQFEAADALGLAYHQKITKIILPQALRKVIPPLVNTFIALFKDTSLVSIVGIFDLLTAAKTSISEPIWQGFSIEVYAVVAAIYFTFCYAMSRYSRSLETTLQISRRA